RSVRGANPARYQHSRVRVSRAIRRRFFARLGVVGGTSGTATSSSALLIPDPVAQTNQKDGFTFTYAVTGNSGPGGTPSAYTVNANPTTPDTTGRRWFFTDESFVIRYNATGPSTANDPGI